VSLAQPVPTLAARRAENLAQLSPGARRLIAAQSGEARWVGEGVLTIAPERCARLVGARDDASGCVLVALGAGRAALLVARVDPGCADERCVERSWVFLPSRETPLPLPQRRRSDYHALSAELPARPATALWLAGFRAYDDAPRRAGASAPADALRAAAAEVADYARCTLDAGEHELLCPTVGGDVIALDPLHGTRRLHAQRD